MNVIGVRFRTAGKIYYFDPGELEIKRGDHVIVETARGVEYGTVMLGVTEKPDEKVTQPLKPVIRIATPEDDARVEANHEREKSAFGICQEKIAKHGLEMKLIDVEYTFDANKILFYFTADGRVDFRELVKDLAGVFRTRIELRQIGVRDETKLIGGCGVCGRPLCCHSYLSDFIPVSIKMAKEQNLSLNPGKISGLCGRLMCCLKYEEETYEDLNSRLPRVGDQVTTPDGMQGEVQSVNILRQRVQVVVETGEDEKEARDYPVEELTFRPRRRRENAAPKENKKGRGRGEDGESGGRGDQSGRGQQEDREGGDRSGRREKREDGNRPGRGERRGDRDRSGRGEKREDGDRPVRGEKREDGERPARGQNEEREGREGGRRRRDRRDRRREETAAAPDGMTAPAEPQAAGNVAPASGNVPQAAGNDATAPENVPQTAAAPAPERTPQETENTAPEHAPGENE